MVHQSKNERDKYACKFCDKILCYTTSIRRHAQMCHPTMFANLGKNSKQLSQLIRGKDNNQSPKPRKEKIPLNSRETKSKLNFDGIGKNRNNLTATLKFKQKDVLKLLPKKEDCKEEKIPGNVITDSGKVPIGISSVKNVTSKILACEIESSLCNEIQGEGIISNTFINPINKNKVEILEEIKEEKKLRVDTNRYGIYEQIGDNLDKLYLHAEISNTVPTIDYNTMDHFIYEDLVNPLELEDPGISHYEY